LPCPATTTAGASGGTPGPGSSPGTPPLTPPTNPYQNILPTLPNAPNPTTTTPATTPVFPPVNVAIISYATLNLFGRTNIIAQVAPFGRYITASSGGMAVSGTTISTFTPSPVTPTINLDFTLSSDKTRVTAKE